MRSVSLSIALAAALLALVASSAAARASHPRSARASHALKATDKAQLHIVSASGPWLYEVGKASGTLPGGMKAHMRLAARFTGSFLIDTRYGSISGHGVATPHGSGVWESFAGTLTVTGGTRRYRGAHGTAGLYGTFNRRTYQLIVKTTGTLRY